MNLTPIKDSKSGLIFTFEMSDKPSKAELAALKSVTTEMYRYLRERAIQEIPSLLSYTNFFGEAEQYIYTNNIIYTPTTRTLYAKAIYQEFIQNLPELIQYDSATNEILLSPYLIALEYGDFYRPALEYVSRCLQQWIDGHMHT